MKFLHHFVFCSSLIHMEGCYGQKKDLFYPNVGIINCHFTFKNCFVLFLALGIKSRASCSLRKFSEILGEELKNVLHLKQEGQTVSIFVRNSFETMCVPTWFCIKKGSTYVLLNNFFLL